jgi:hypothetical protein
MELVIHIEKIARYDGELCYSVISFFCFSVFFLMCVVV